jgi:hypothetical protein
LLVHRSPLNASALLTWNVVAWPKMTSAEIHMENSFPSKVDNVIIDQILNQFAQSNRGKKNNDSN